MRERYCRDRGLDAETEESTFEKNSETTEIAEVGEEVEEEQEEEGEEEDEEEENEEVEEEQEEEPKFEFVKIPEQDLQRTEIVCNFSEKTKNVSGMKSDKKDHSKNGLTETTDTSLMRGK